jgi:hypothetical protein
MIEDEWLACEDPAPMLEWLRGWLDHRAARLFVCACRARLEPHFTDNARAVLAALERTADRDLRLDELYAEAGFPHSDGAFTGMHAAVTKALSEALNEVLTPPAMLAPRRTRAYVVDAVRTLAGPEARTAEWQRQSDLVRCLFGNPFRISPPFAPAWRTDTVRAIARHAHESRAFDALPVLADALQEAGCDDEPLLAHLRCGGSHAFGCRVLERVLGDRP